MYVSRQDEKKAAARPSHSELASIEIVSPQDIGPDWMTKVLRRKGIDATVARVEMEAVGTGQVAETRRFTLTYEASPPPEAPRSLIGKFPSDDKVSAETGKSLGVYRAEVMFYRELAARARIRTPSPYLAEIDELENFVLLLEDMAPAKVGDQMAGCTVSQAKVVLSEAAKLHASFWNDTELFNLDGVNEPEGSQPFYTTALIESAWDNFKKTYPGRLEQSVEEVCETYVRNHAYWNSPRKAPKCYQHCDFRLDNMLFSPDGMSVAVVDWQSLNLIGSGLDVAYFLGSAFSSRETRRSNESHLLEGYYSDLVLYGVRDYSFDQLVHDYRHYTFAQLAVAIAGAQIVKRTERGDRMFIHMITGAAHQIIDNNALDLLKA